MKVARGKEWSPRMLPSLVVAVSIASAALGAVLAAGAASHAQSGGNTPAETSDPDAVRRPPTIEESFPSLSAVPNRPKPTANAAERAAITGSLVGDRQNAQYTSQALRGGEEAAAPPPRSLPPVAGQVKDPNEERRRVADETGVTPFGSYTRRADGAAVPPPAALGARGRILCQQPGGQQRPWSCRHCSAAGGPPRWRSARHRYGLGRSGGAPSGRRRRPSVPSACRRLSPACRYRRARNSARSLRARRRA